MAPAHAGEIGSLQLRAVEGPGGPGGLVVARRGQGTRGEEGATALRGQDGRSAGKTTSGRE